MKHRTIGVDLAKNVFEIGISDRPGHVAETYRVSRAKCLPFFSNQKPATVVMEACGSAHHWGRQIGGLGHTVVLISPQYVRPYVPRDKTDRADVKGLLEAFRNGEIEPVPVKTVAQQQLTSLHRIRSAWMATRTAQINTLRGLLREFGLVLPVGARHLVPGVMGLIEDAEVEIPDTLREVFGDICTEIRDLERRVRSVERHLEALGEQTPGVERLRSIPGVGLLTSTALVGFVGDVQRFRSGRHFSSYLGITPREHSSGGRRRLGRISKRGDRYLRSLLIHGARSVLWAARSRPEPSPFEVWALRIQELRGHNKAAVAVANRMARQAWAVWKRDCDYEARVA